MLVLGEALAIGALAGLVSAVGAYCAHQLRFRRTEVSDRVFPGVFHPDRRLWWGLSVGAGTALVGSILPAWTACRVKVSEIFAKVD